MPPPATDPSTLAQGSTAWSFLIGLGGAAVPLSVMWVKLRLDQLSARCDAFAEAVEKSMELALDYWLTGQPTGQEPDTEGSDKAKERDASIAKDEIRLRGAQAALQADVERMAVDLPPRFRAPLQAEFRNVIDALTGEPFGDRDGYTQPDKASAAMSSGTRLVRIVREGRDEVSRFPYMLWYIIGLPARKNTWAALVIGATIFGHEILPCLLFAGAILTPSTASVCQDLA